MEPIRDRQATLVDLLERILDKGLIIHADIIISLAGVPLIGVNLRAALAGMETMLKYGMFHADDAVRGASRLSPKSHSIPLAHGEEIVLKQLGSYYYSQGIYTAWRHGYLYLTTKKLLLYHPEFDNVLLQIPLAEIQSFAKKRLRHSAALEERAEIVLTYGDQRSARLRTAEVDGLLIALEKRIGRTAPFPADLVHRVANT
ncbi:MAG: gas vesicle protein [Acidobacteria bacterium]|nr:gas vesicle protein [Acidobacteriota bacterium]MBI3654833.1 gas vesicle protein [Acidobacteriota bacterium]